MLGLLPKLFHLMHALCLRCFHSKLIDKKTEHLRKFDSLPKSNIQQIQSQYFPLGLWQQRPGSFRFESFFLFASWWLWQLSSVGQLFGRMSLNWNLTDVFLITILRLEIWGRKTTEVKCHSYQGFTLSTYDIDT